MHKTFWKINKKLILLFTYGVGNQMAGEEWQDKDIFSALTSVALNLEPHEYITQANSKIKANNKSPLPFFVKPQLY